jgi:hypothetical protein
LTNLPIYQFTNLPILARQAAEPREPETRNPKPQPASSNKQQASSIQQPFPVAKTPKTPTFAKNR